jgi:hypothetical protein
MNKFRLLATSIAILLLLAFSISESKAINGPGVYGGGPIYNARTTSVPNLRESGFKWVVVWTIHVMNQNGDLNFNAEFPVVENGTYVGSTHYPYFADDMALLKTEPTSVEWIEFGLAGWGSGTFGIIRDLVNSEGTGPGSTLYENFAALKAAIPEIDAISFDDEDYYDEPTTTQFAIMLADLGYKVSVCPYTNATHWQNVVANVNAQRPGTIEDVHVQCYAGGAGNNPCTWDSYFSSEINVMPGVEDGSNILSQMWAWNNQCGISSGWVWLYDNFYNNLSTVQSHAKAVNSEITQLYLVGNGTEVGWNNQSDVPLTKTGDGLFTWTGTLISRHNTDNGETNRRFKFLTQYGEWDPGVTCQTDIDGHEVVVPGEELDLYVRAHGAEGFDNAFQVETTGEYTIDIDLNAMKMTVVDASTVGIRDNPDEEAPFSVISEGAKIGIIMKDSHIAQSFEVYNISGRLVYSANYVNNRFFTDAGFNTGMYVVKVRFENKVYSSKIVVR